MERSIRIGKDFNVRWSINKVVDGERQPYELAGKELVLQYRTPYGLKEATEWKVVGNTIVWTFRGKEQKALGSYELILTENGGKDGMVTVDTCRAFKLVAHSCEETEGSGSDIVIEDVVLESEVAFAALRGPQGPAGPSYNDTEIKGKLAELSAEISDDKSFLYNPFTKKGMAFAENDEVPSYYSYANADSSEYLEIPNRMKGRLYLSTSNPNYKISFLDVNKKFVSNYQTTTTGLQEVEIKKEDLPSNAHYMVITTYAVYSGQSYLLLEWYPFLASVNGLANDVASMADVVDNIGTQQSTIFDMAANARLSKGVVCPTGKVSVTLKYLEGTNANFCNIYRYTGGVFNSEKLVDGAVVGNTYEIEIPEGDNGIWLFLEAGTSAYKLSCVVSTKLYAKLDSIENSINKEEKTTDSWKGKTIVCFGDSLTEFKDYDNNKAYADYIRDFTGAEVYNIGIGGSQVKQRTQPVATPTNHTEAYAALDWINMVKACCDKDFSKQIAATNYLTANDLDRNDDIIALMQTIDWSKVDVVTFFGGSNDWGSNTAIKDTPITSTDIFTTTGAINEIIRILLTTYPHLRVYWFSPVVSWPLDDNGERTNASWCDNLVRDGLTKREFAAKIIEVVKQHHIPVCDLYNTIGWNQYNFSDYFTDTDGSHPRKGEGNMTLARKIIGFIDSTRGF